MISTHHKWCWCGVCSRIVASSPKLEFLEATAPCTTDAAVMSHWRCSFANPLHLVGGVWGCIWQSGYRDILEWASILGEVFTRGGVGCGCGYRGWRVLGDHVWWKAHCECELVSGTVCISDDVYIFVQDCCKITCWFFRREKLDVFPQCIIFIMWRFRNFRKGSG